MWPFKKKTHTHATNPRHYIGGCMDAGGLYFVDAFYPMYWGDLEHTCNPKDRKLEKPEGWAPRYMSEEELYVGR